MPKIFFGNLGIGHFIGYWELEIGYWELSPEGGNPQAFRHPDKMGGEGVEPSSLSAYGSEPYVFANFTTRPAHFIGTCHLPISPPAQPILSGCGIIQSLFISSTLFFVL